MVEDAVWELVYEQYAEGATASELARSIGVNERRVRDRLVRRGLHIPGRKRTGGDTCPAGLHSMEKYGAQRWKENPDGTKVKNGRHCKMCKKIREQKRNANRRKKTSK